MISKRNTNESIHGSDGFTVLELLLYVTISSSVLLIAVMFMGAMLEARIKNEVIAEVEQQGHAAMHKIVEVLRNGQSVVSPTPGNASTILSVATYAPLMNPTIFDVATGTLRIKEGATSTVPLTSSSVAVSGFSVHNVSRAATPGSVRVMFTVRYNAESLRGEYEYAKTFIGTGSLRQP